MLIFFRLLDDCRRMTLPTSPFLDVQLEGFVFFLFRSTKMGLQADARRDAEAPGELAATCS